MVPLLQRRLFCNKSFHQNHRQWPIKQVTKSNFDDSLSEIKQRISTSDFVAVFLQNTGSSSSPWQRVSAFDTPATAYSKAKSAAERFQTLQFAVCPFTLQASKLTAYPYNFHLFPRDEHKLGMPSYSFTCQTSSLTSMAREGFDFNACIYDGISYLSRAQEYAAKFRIGIPMPVDHKTKSSSPTTVADTVFVERIRTRVRHWKNVCTDISTTKLEDAFVRSLRTIVLGSEKYGSRPSITIDVCSDRQVQLVLEMLEQSDNLVPLLVPAKSGGIQSVRAVLTSSQEDKNLLKMELQNLEVDQTKRVRGFREVIDLISASQKPVVSYNSLNDFTFIHSKFIAPLPPTVDEFTNSLHLAFPVVLDVNHLVKNIVPVKKTTNISATMSYLKNRFVAPVDMEIPHEDVINEGNNHGHNVVKICHLFGKLCSVLKITPSAIQSGNHHLAASALQGYESVFKLCPKIPQESTDEEDIRIWTNNTRKVSCQDVVFLWGFKKGTTAGMLKSLLQGSHEVFTEEFDLRLVDRSCAIVVFWQPGSSQTFLDVMNGKDFSGKLMEMVSEGVRASGYEAYKRVCSSGLWESELADSLDKALASSECNSESDSESKPSEIYWCSELMINLDDL
ncbi:hypothetical protein Q3G72_022316 [Acer saccharum]|nr:hypothetical protein Q3G72_022316 [Acer saccharum]